METSSNIGRKAFKLYQAQPFLELVKPAPHKLHLAKGMKLSQHAVG
jgi:hypothetical protein